jgi:uncharacterized paraquat-inducible protein A
MEKIGAKMMMHINQKIPEEKNSYFVLEFICEKCETSYRLKDLEKDYIGRYHCPYCKKMLFKVKQKPLSKTKAIWMEDKDIVIIEKRRGLNL